MQASDSYATNQYEIRVYGIRRSGNHAIASWILSHFNGVTVHLNDTREKISSDPYKAFAQVFVQGMSFWKCKPKITSFLKHQLKRSPRMLFVRSDSTVNIEYIRAYHPKALSMLSFEDHPLGDEGDHLFARDYQTYVGSSETIKNVVILRDVYNLFASLLKSKMMHKGNCSKFVTLYKAYAGAYLRHASESPDPTIFVNYNQWCMEADYRIEIANQIGFDTLGSAFQEISHMGGGSSFDKLNARQDPGKLQGTQHRWKNFVDDPFYRSIFQDEELKHLSDQIFGNIAGAF